MQPCFFTDGKLRPKEQRNNLFKHTAELDQTPGLADPKTWLFPLHWTWERESPWAWGSRKPA